MDRRSGAAREARSGAGDDGGCGTDSGSAATGTVMRVIFNASPTRRISSASSSIAEAPVDVGVPRAMRAFSAGVNTTA